MTCVRTYFLQFYADANMMPRIASIQTPTYRTASRMYGLLYKSVVSCNHGEHTQQEESVERNRSIGFFLLFMHDNSFMKQSVLLQDLWKE